MIPASSLFLFPAFIASMFQIYDEPPSQPHYTYTDPWAQETGRSQGQGQGVGDLYTAEQQSESLLSAIVLSIPNIQILSNIASMSAWADLSRPP